MVGEDEKKPKPRRLSEVMREAVRVAEDAGTTVRQLAESVVQSAMDLAEAASEQTSDAVKSRASSVVSQVRAAAERASSQVRHARDSVTTRTRDLEQQARRTIEIVDQISLDISDTEKTVSHFIEGVSLTRPHLDARAGAVLLGHLGLGGTGLSHVQGREVLYVRATQSYGACIQVRTLEGRSARLARGPQTSAFSGCMYGNRDAMMRESVRRGADAGFAVKAFSFFRSVVMGETETASGWWVALSSGLDLGMPLLSELGAFEISARPVTTIDLSRGQTDQIEAALAGATDRSLIRAVAESLL